MIDNVNGDLDDYDIFGIDDEQQTAICGNCNGTGSAYGGRFSPFRGTCRECLGSGEVVCD